MKKVKNDLQAVTKEFKALRKKVGQLTSKLGKTAVEELDHVQTRVKLKSPAQYAADALKSLTRETDKLVKAVDKFEKETAAKTKKAKVQAQAKTRKKGASKKKPVAKKAKAVTATDEVLNIVRRSKKGIGSSI